jgi:hypothetical protein
MLKVHATLVPKIYLMDYKFKDKLKDNTISIAIVYKSKEYKKAKELQNLIRNRYKDGIKSYKINPFLIRYNKVQMIDANVYYLFPAKSDDIKKVVQKADENQALTFSYLRDDLKYGVMISLNVSKKIKPLLNLEAIKKYQIVLRPVLIDISAIFINDIESLSDKFKIQGFYNCKVYQV